MIICRGSFTALTALAWRRRWRCGSVTQSDLIDFAFHLPRRAKLDRNTSKWLVKQAAENCAQAGFFNKGRTAASTI